LWDRFPDGDRLGGAPANFTFHAAQLGADARMISRIGSDPDGDRLASLLAERRLTLDFLQRDPQHRTGLVRVELAHGQPTYTIEEPAAWDFLELTPELVTLAGHLDAVCFGTLAQRDPVSRRTIQKFVELCPKTTLRLFDINLRQQFYSAGVIEFGLTHASAIKLNGDELRELASLFNWPAETEAAIAKIFERYPVEVIALTLGAEGCEIYTRKNKVHAAARKITCVDAVGAGDAFAAAFATGLLAHKPLDEIADRANRVGGYVASQAGGMPPLPEHVTL
jgi:fructokinase